MNTNYIAAQFYVSEQEICVGESILFTITSINGDYLTTGIMAMGTLQAILFVHIHLLM